jgi:hypothetical protein
MPSAALTLLGNADGDARVTSICDPVQDLLTIGAVKPFGDIQAFNPKEAISAFDTTAVQLALLAAPDAQPISIINSMNPSQRARTKMGIDNPMISIERSDHRRSPGSM